MLWASGEGICPRSRRGTRWGAGRMAHMHAERVREENNAGTQSECPKPLKLRLHSFAAGFGCLRVPGRGA